MTPKMKAVCLLCAPFCLIHGCATVNPASDYERVSRQIEATTGQRAEIDPAEAHAARQQTLEIIADGITGQEAARLCLINNPRLQAAFLQIGIGRAEVVQSGLFSNPSLALSARLPDEGGLADFEVSLAQNIAELWQIKHRRRAAEQNLERIILSIAREASLITLEARSTYIKSLQADRDVGLAREGLSIANQLVELADARLQAGSGTTVDVNLARAEALFLGSRLRNAESAAVAARADLSKLLGLTVPPSELILADALPEPRDLPFGALRVIDVSKGNRLDLKAADAVIHASQERLAYERSRVFKNVELGISMERSERRSRGDRDWLADTAWASAEAGALTLPSLQPRDPVSTDYVTGPMLSLELPLFDQNQAQVARAEYELLQATHLRDSIEREIVQDSWAAFSRAKSAFENAKFMRDELLPLRDTGLTLARDAFQVGTTTILTVLEAQRTLLESRTGYVQALADAALATIELERISGQPFAALSTAPEQHPSQTPENRP